MGNHKRQIEVVRRILNAYADTKTEAVDLNELIDRLLTEAVEMLGEASRAIGDLNRQLDSMQQRIDSGDLRREVETEMRQWLAENQESVQKFRKYVMPVLDRNLARADR